MEIFKEENMTVTGNHIGDGTVHEVEITSLSNKLYDVVNSIDREIKSCEENLARLRTLRNVLMKNVTDIVNKANS